MSIDRTETEAKALGIPVQRLVAVDLDRYRTMALAAVPMLSPWEASLLRQLLAGMEQVRLYADDDSLPDAKRLVAEIDTWADTANEADTMRAARLREIVARLSPVAVAGLFFQMRLAV